MAPNQTYAGMSREDAQTKIDSLKWWHGFDFGDGLKAYPDGIPMTDKYAEAFFGPINMSGRTLIDIGTWSGAYSHAAKKAGASRVLATDHFVWTVPEHAARPTFDLARELAGLDIEDRDIDVPDITPESVGNFDVVLFSGVFYHLINAAHLTRQIGQCASKLLIIETHQDALDNPRPAMIFYPGKVLADDPSNWWGPNPHCMYEMLTEFGFSRIFYQDAPTYDDEGSWRLRLRGMYHAFRTDADVREMGAKTDRKGWYDLSDPQIRARIFKPITA